MPYPAVRHTRPTAWAMSPMRLPTTAAAMPASRASSAVAISRRSSGRARPTVKLTAESPTQPSRIAPQSRLTRSPSRRRYPSGMPCTIASLTEAQMTAGKGMGAQEG